MEEIIESSGGCDELQGQHKSNTTRLLCVASGNTEEGEEKKQPRAAVINGWLSQNTGWRVVPKMPLQNECFI